MIVIGSVLFFKNNYSFISRIIAKLTKSEFTHVGLIVDYDELTGVATIIESNRFIETRLFNIKIDNEHVVYSTGVMTDKIRNDVVKFAYKELGTKYDYFQVLGLFVSLLFKEKRMSYFDSRNKLICSELIDLAYCKAGVPRKNTYPVGNISPQELIEVYDLKRM